MIIVDNFLDDTKLNIVDQDDQWDHVIKYYTWYDCSKPPSNVWENLIEEVVVRLGLDRPLGFEYWANKLSNEEDLPWHVDKDETQNGKYNRIVPSDYSCVFYGRSTKFWGGMLEVPVEDTKSEVERIAPKYNRIVMMPKNLEHRVTKVWTGDRYAFSFGAWNEKPELFEKSDLVEANELRELLYGKD